MMEPIRFWNRSTGEVETEEVYGDWALRLTYGDGWLARLIGRPLLHAFFKRRPFSDFYGWLQKRPASASKVLPFIERYSIDSSEFLDPPESFQSFNDFFCRKLNRDARPFNPDPHEAVLPADGRYLFYQTAREAETLLVKGQRFSLASFLQDEALAADYMDGALVLARLCPVDYHRFHFPCDGVVSAPKLINGYLYSVNPWALQQNIQILSENKRMLTEIDSPRFGRVLMVEIGATNVGSICYTYKNNSKQKKADEKGYFSFGGSASMLLFPPNALRLDEDLIACTRRGLEAKCLMGQPLGSARH